MFITTLLYCFVNGEKAGEINIEHCSVRTVLIKFNFIHFGLLHFFYDNLHCNQFPFLP